MGEGIRYLEIKREGEKAKGRWGERERGGERERERDRDK